MPSRAVALALTSIAVLVLAVSLVSRTAEPAVDELSRSTTRATSVASTRMPSPEQTISGFTCEQGGDPTLSDGEVLVYFPCGTHGVEMAAVVRSAAANEEPPARLAAAVDEVLLGPRPQEVAAGFKRSVPAEWHHVAHSVRLDGDELAVIDFDPSILSLTAPNTSAQFHSLTSSLGRTALEAAAVERVEVHIGGSCGAFVVWMGEISDCGVAGNPPGEGSSLQRWALDSAEVDGERLPIVGSVLVSESSISGFAPCSQYEIRFEGETVTSADVTQRFCSNPEDATHARYFAALERLTTASFGAGVLALNGPGIELRFSR